MGNKKCENCNIFICLKMHEDDTVSLVYLMDSVLIYYVVVQFIFTILMLWNFDPILSIRLVEWLRAVMTRVCEGLSLAKLRNSTVLGQKQLG